MDPAAKKLKTDPTKDWRESLTTSTVHMSKELENSRLKDDEGEDAVDLGASLLGDTTVSAAEDLLLLSSDEDSLDLIIDDILGHKHRSPVGVKTRGMHNSGGLRLDNPDMELTKGSLPLTEFNPVAEERMKNTHPLTLLLVVDRIMEFLDASDLKSCRLVTRQWNCSAVSCIKVNHPPIALTKPSQMFLFTRIMKQAKEFPYTNFKLRSRYTPRVEKYFQTFGLEITSIEILSSPGKSFIEFRNVFKLMKTMPNLKTLRLINVEFQKANTPDLIQTPLLMEHLESLSFTGWYLSRLTQMVVPLNQRDQECIDEFYNSIPHLKHLQLNIMRATIVHNFLFGLSQLKELRSLNVYSIVETDLKHLITASDHLQSLRSLTLREVHMTHHGEILLKLMETYTTRLECFDIRVLTTRGIRIIKFPEMKALKSLHLETYFATDSFIVEDFMERSYDPFPALKKLMVSQTVLNAMMFANYKSTSITELIVKMNPLPVMGFRNGIQDEEELENVVGCNPPQASMILKIKENFPGLKKLKIVNAKCSVLRYIFRTLTSLEELEIHHSIQRYGIYTTVSLNPTLTGLSYCDWLSRMYTNYQHLSPAEEHNQIVLEFIYAISPDSIRNMRNLKVLILSGRQCIDDSSVQFGLLPLQPLDRLVLYQNAISFGDNTLEQLRKRHKVVQILKTEEPTDSFFNIAI